GGGRRPGRSPVGACLGAQVGDAGRRSPPMRTITVTPLPDAPHGRPPGSRRRTPGALQRTRRRQRLRATISDRPVGPGETPGRGRWDTPPPERLPDSGGGKASTCPFRAAPV